MVRAPTQVPFVRKQLAILSVLAFVLLGPACRRGRQHPPGESADAAAAGSGYGVGRSTGEIKAEKERSGTGPSATGNADPPVFRQDAGAAGHSTDAK
jgi:hypothetical protein